MKQNELIYIVGDKFNKFSSLSSIINVSEFKKIINQYKNNPHGQTVDYIVSQGVSAHQLQEIIELIKSQNSERTFNLINAEDFITKKEDKFSVHKHQQSNVLITRPIKLNETSYSCQLTIDENCAEMSDHVTGMHIQGMVLIEAARQMMLSVTETYFLSEKEQSNSYFVLNSVNSSFNQFTFPLDINLQYSVNRAERIAKNILKSTVTISIIQNRTVVGNVDISFAVYDKTFIAEKEAQLASKAIFEQLNIDHKLLPNKKAYPTIINQTFQQSVYC